MNRCFAVLIVPLFLLGCDQEIENMPRPEALEPSAVFEDGMSARHAVPGTVARDAALGPQRTRLPDKINRAYLERGQERFNIFCAPCHSRSGNGDGMIVQRGFPAPPSFHQEALRHASDRYFFNVITNGYGIMYSYAARVPPDDRWAIVAWIRTLQLSRHAPVSSLPGALRERLSRGDTQ